MPTLKEQALISIQRLPENASAEDIIDSILLTEKVNSGIAEIDGGKGIPHSEIKKLASDWIGK